MENRIVYRFRVSAYANSKPIVSSIFCRLAAMLNYFLKTLTGPGQKNFKVKNLEQYSFKPGQIVARISGVREGEEEKKYSINCRVLLKNLAGLSML